MASTFLTKRISESEEGLFGKEEIKEILPAIREAIKLALKMAESKRKKPGK